LAVNSLLLGVGNILLGDDGVGVRVIEKFGEQFVLPVGLDVVDGGTAGMNLLDIAAGRDGLIIVDAVEISRAPGTLVRLVGEEVPAYFDNVVSRHEVGPKELLATLDLIGQAPRQLVVIGIVPHDLGFRVGLSAEVGQSVDRAVGLVADQLRVWGYDLERRILLAEHPARR
jgi:hydrogenase maturation protease